FGIEFSIEVVIMVAVGGRGTLYGAIIGAVLVNLASTHINNEFENAWRFILGGLFIGIVAFLPNGLVGLGHSLVNGLGRLKTLYQAWSKLPETEPARPADFAPIQASPLVPRDIKAATDVKGP